MSWPSKFRGAVVRILAAELHTESGRLCLLGGLLYIGAVIWITSTEGNVDILGIRLRNVQDWTAKQTLVALGGVPVYFLLNVWIVERRRGDDRSRGAGPNHPPPPSPTPPKPPKPPKAPKTRRRGRKNKDR